MTKNYFWFFILFVLGLSLGVFFGKWKLSKEKLLNNAFNFSITTPKPTPVLDNKITLIAVGDVLLARKVNYKMVSMNNFNWPFEKTADILKSSDFTFANLESPIVENCKPTETGMVFCGDKRAVFGLVFAGFDGFNLANNHSLNYGKEGLSQTKGVLTSAQIGFFGNDDVLRKEIKGVKFSFLGFNEVGLGQKAYQDLISQVVLKIKSEKEVSDFIVVSFHWGNEYTEEISPRQKELAHLAIDSGAGLVVGHHPHWIQGKEEYQGKFIFYSLGNFVFDQMWSEKTKEGLIVRFTLEGNEIIKTEEFKVKIEDFGQPYLVD